MLPFRTLRVSRAPRLLAQYSTEVTKKKAKKAATADISRVPIKNIGVIADFYVPPRILGGPVKLWPRLLLRRLGVFAVNTYSIVRYKRETGLKLHFDDWKEKAMEKFVHTNKIFAAGCNRPVSEREQYLKTQLEDVAGTAVVKKLTERALSFPPGGKISWELVSVETNPKVVSFTALPDGNDIATYVQLILQVTTKQKVSVSAGEKSTDTERTVTDNLVYTLNPFTNEVVLVGTLFEASYERGIQPELNFNNSQVMVAFQNQCADIYRSS